MSQRIRKRIEEGFGWAKTIGGQRKTRFKGRDRVGWAFTFAMAAYNLVRLPKLMAKAGVNVQANGGSSTCPEASEPEPPQCLGRIYTMDGQWACAV